jgi:hypothetical protein
VKGGFYSYQNGKYSASIEFSKSELEAAPVESKSIDVPVAGADSYVFAQAYLEFADGTRKNISRWNWSGGGISNMASYQDPNNNNSINYAQFDY